MKHIRLFEAFTSKEQLRSMLLSQIVADMEVVEVYVFKEHGQDVVQVVLETGKGYGENLRPKVLELSAAGGRFSVKKDGFGGSDSRELQSFAERMLNDFNKVFFFQELD
jgi:hypothetical protein